MKWVLVVYFLLPTGAERVEERLELSSLHECQRHREKVILTELMPHGTMARVICEPRALV